MIAPQRYSNGLAWQARAGRVWAAGNDAQHGVRMIGRRVLVGLDEPGKRIERDITSQASRVLDDDEGGQ